MKDEQDDTMNQPTGLAVRAHDRAMVVAQAFRGLVPTTIGEAFELSKHLASSEVIPKSLRGKPDSVLAVVLTGLEIGLTPMQSVNNISIISGNLALKANLQLAIVRGSGLLAYWDEGWDTTDQDPMKHRGWCEVSRKGDTDPKTGHLRVYRREFTVAMAKAALVWEKGDDGEKGKMTPLADKFNYKSWPDRMYAYRARSWVLEAVFGDVLKGLPSAEGLMDGQVVDAEVIQVPQGDDIQALMAKLMESEPEVATAIEAGMDALDMGPAKRLVLLRQHQANPKNLADWLRDEFTKRKTGKPREPKAATESKPANGGGTAAAATATAAEQRKPAVVDAEVVTEHTEPAKPAADAQAAGQSTAALFGDGENFERPAGSARDRLKEMAAMKGKFPSF